MSSRNVNNKKCAPKLVFFNEKKIRDLDDFYHSELTLKVKFWHFLTTPHEPNSQNAIISFNYIDS